MIGLYVKDTFLSAYEALDGIFKERTLETLAQLTEGILMSAKNLEKVTRCFMLYTLRVNSGYRIIVKKISADAYILLYTGNHDDVYEWAENNRKSYKRISSDLSGYRKVEEVFPEITKYMRMQKAEQENEAVSPENDTAETGPFGFLKNFTDKELLLGLENEDVLSVVRNWNSKEECLEGAESLSRRSREFIRTLLSTGKIDDAVHSVFISDRHEEMDRKVAETIETLKDYAKKQADGKFGHPLPISNEDQRIDYSYFTGFAGCGKTTRLLNKIKVNEGYFEESKDSRKALYLICNPDNETETRAYMSAVFEKKYDFLEVLTFDEMFRKQMDECSSRWKLDFSIKSLSEESVLYNMFRDCVIETEGDDSLLGLYLDEWTSVVEEKSVYTAVDYLNCSRVGSFPIDEDDEYQFSCFLNIFTERMKQTGIYSYGFALHRFTSLCKKKSHRPYSVIFADDIHYLSAAQLALVNVFIKDDKSLLTYDTAFTIGSPYFLDTDRKTRMDNKVVGTFAGLRMKGKKAEWIKKFNEELFIPVIPDKVFQNMTRTLKNEVSGPDNLVPLPFDGKYSDKEKMMNAIVDFVGKEDDPESCALIASDKNEAEFISTFLKNLHIPHLLLDSNHSNIDSILEPGVRIGTLCSLGSCVFKNIILFRPEEKAIAECSEVPSYVKSTRTADKTAARVYLFERAVCASLETTYYLSSSEDRNLFSLD